MKCGGCGVEITRWQQCSGGCRFVVGYCDVCGGEARSAIEMTAHITCHLPRPPMVPVVVTPPVVGCLHGKPLYRVTITRTRWAALQENPRFFSPQGYVVDWICVGEDGYSSPVLLTSCPEVFEKTKP